MITKEDKEVIQGACNSLIFVRAGLGEEDATVRELLSRSMRPLAKILHGDTDSTPTELTERVARLEQQVRDLSRVNG